MYYIRLDSVVTVIDSDSMLQQIQENLDLGVAMRCRLIYQFSL